MSAAIQYRLCKTTDIPKGEGRRVCVGEKTLAVFHTTEGFFAIEDVCLHKKGPMSDGLLAGFVVFCPLHNWGVDVRTGDVVKNGEGSVVTYDLLTEGDSLILSM